MIWRSGTPKSAAEIHADLSKAALSEVAVALLRLAERSLYANSLVVSPGSPESVQFLIKLKGLVESLEQEQVKPDKIQKLEKRIEELRNEFGGWQRGQTQSLIDDFASAVKSLAMAAGTAVDVQEEQLANLGALHQRLNKAKDSTDLNEIREAIRREAEVAREIIRAQTTSNEQLKGQFQEAVRELNQRISQAEEACQTDHLTKLGNRAAFEFYAEAAVQKARHGDGAYSLAMIDLDGFKPLNDKLGHAAGDEALNAFAGRLRRQFPKPAFVGRIGGDEFVVVCRLDQAGTTKRLADLENDLRRHPIHLCTGEKAGLGFSFGCESLGKEESVRVSLKNADERMYEAKRAKKPKAA